MRLIAFILLMSMFLSSYSTVAHAFGADPCSTHSQEQTQQQDVSLPDCHDHQQGSESDLDKSKDAQHVNCHHCCMSHMGLSQGFVQDLAFSTEALSPSLSQSFTDSYVFSLLRPPKNLI